MQTRIFKPLPDTLEESWLPELIEILKAGGVAALPTETVYGLSANALDEGAVDSIFRIKGRPQDNPLIVHVASVEMAKTLASEFPPAAERLAERFWPGPLTMVLKKSALVPDGVSAGLPTVGIRFPAHPLMRRVIEKSGLPLAAPSANLSGYPSPTNAEHCIADLLGRVDAILDGGACSVGVESTIVSVAGARPRLLRPGGIPPEALIAVLGDLEWDRAVSGESDPSCPVAAPGMKYRHYAPRAQVRLVVGGREQYCQFVNHYPGEGVYALCFSEEQRELNRPSLALCNEDDLPEAARRLFWALREFDEKGAKTVLAHCPNREGVGLAVYNRLLRAAAFDEIEL